MLGQHLRELIPGNDHHLDSEAARHVEVLSAWRRRSLEEQWLALGGDESPFVPSIEPVRGRVRLGLFCPCLGLGGAESWQLALIRAIDPELVAWQGAVVTDGRQLVAPKMLGPLSSRMPVGFGLNAARALAESSDVLISWSVLDYGAVFRGLHCPPRVALACHFPGEMPWTSAAEQLLSRVTRLVAVSELAVESLPVSLRGQAKVIWNAVDGTRLNQTRTVDATRSEWGILPGVKVAGYLGRLSAEKDPDAMLRLAQELPDHWYVVVVGDGRERQAMADKVARLGLSRVRLVPGTAEVGDTLAAFDSLVVPSLYESFGLTMAEGFWSGVPVVATRSGLAKVVPGLVQEIGFVSSGTELAAAILLDHKFDVQGRLARVARARSFAEERLDLARFGSEWTSLVVDLAGRNPSSHRREEPCRPTIRVA